jgi:hypothetical protein
MKQSYGLDKKQAAVKALERGENLTKVSHQFQVLKTQYLNTVIILLLNCVLKEMYLYWRKT